MNLRWKRILIPPAILVVLIACFIALLPLLHPLRVWVAGGVWCVQSDPEGNLDVLYGSQACDPPQAAAQPE